MYRLNVKKFGFALGLTVSLIYLGCMIVMATAGQEGTIIFFNSLLHGLDTSNIIRMDVPLLEAFFGIVQSFILGWLIGACIAAFYNAQIKNR
ncbi:hypothetical protein INR75_12655 [Zunongwangia sp. SCSIO 43204]|jgi:hypothetical protein|uniref:Uncharacterized protein n=4 Tax=Flavobacteriaceae TaxID=49546 RepID=A0A0Q9ZJJ2_9FLAO|nr:MULTISPECIES: DUF5676 family membrane protein [Flavobacteriaceae]MBQ0738611.1 hypothetical protein [Aquimarina celericrescens]APS39863.1 hypothetical protein AO058_13700 [Salegentibacter sp. T436]KRG29818.1 hypothetical protein APR42_15390 [Salegentibacter mishustinae]MBO2545378.1 hypothetical protein [Salegentibacter sp. BDJ18]MDT0675535.1 DUF5676 family membrane protein [Zunongwangia sp. F117]|tara:strand:+ start:312 stop:587 length:276 start_codon:yes stop_codon:yes gene_type:complete